MNKHVKSIGFILLLGIAIIIIAALFVVATRLNSQMSTSENTSGNQPSIVEPVTASQEKPITFTNLTENQNLALPYTITGNVIGTWFFEGSFPVFMKNAQGDVLGIALATSSEDWMTAASIPFSVTLPVTNYTGPATLTFTKDNPTGESQFDASVTVPVVIE